MEKRHLQVVEHERSHAREPATERERVGGAEIDNGEEQRELVVDVLQLEQPQAKVS